MGRRGPAPTPTRILQLRGSWRGHANPAEPRPPVEVPKAPAWIPAEARSAFDLLAAQLAEMGVLGAVDAGALARYCVLWLRWRKAEEFLAVHGDTYVVRGRPAADGKPGVPVGFKTYPQAQHALVLAHELLRLEREFGLTPSARARLVLEVGGDEAEPVDPASDFFARGATG